MSKPRKKKRQPKRVQALPDLEQSKAAGAARGRHLQRPKDFLPVHTLVSCDAPKNSVQRPDAESFMSRNGNALVGRYLCLEHNVATSLVNDVVSPLAA